MKGLETDIPATDDVLSGIGSEGEGWGHSSRWNGTGDDSKAKERNTVSEGTFS